MSTPDDLTERLRDIAHAMNDEMYPHKAFTLFKAADRIEELEALVNQVLRPKYHEAIDRIVELEVENQSLKDRLRDGTS